MSQNAQKAYNRLNTEEPQQESAADNAARNTPFKWPVKAESIDEESVESLEMRIANLKETAAKKRQKDQEQIDQEQFNLRCGQSDRLAQLKVELERLNEAGNLKLSLEDALNLTKQKNQVSYAIQGLEHDLGFREIDDPTPAKKKTFGLSSSKAILAIIALSLISFLLFWLMGTAAVSDDPMNDSARRMMNSVGLRVMTNFLPFSMAILTAVGFIWLLFPTVFAYWHSKVTTNLSLTSDLEQCEPYQRVAFFAFSYFLPIWAFVTLMQVIFG